MIHIYAFIYITHTLPFKSLGSVRFLMFLKEVSNAHQDIYLNNKHSNIVLYIKFNIFTI